MFAHAELNAVVEFAGNIPHKVLLSRYRESSLLLLNLTGYMDGAGFLPGKLLEYMATGLPILAVGSVMGDAAALLSETKLGEMLDSDDEPAIKRALVKAFDEWRNSETPVVKKISAQKYSRRMVTEELIKLL